MNAKDKAFIDMELNRRDPKGELKGAAKDKLIKQIMREFF